MVLNDATGVSVDEEVDFTPGEAAIWTKLEELSELILELTERVNNLNLVDNEGYSIDS